VAARAHPLGVELEFSAQVSITSEAGFDGFRARRWNYRWTRDYGSAHYSLAQPGREGEDNVAVLGVAADDSGRRILVELEDMRACQQLQIRWQVASSSGQPLGGEVYLTVHEVPE